jgi:N-acetylglucosamine-6-sulfatase
VTRVFGRTAVRMIHRYVPGPRPLYLQVDEVAPHPARGGRGVTSKCSPVPDPRDEGTFKDTPLPHPPSFDEPDMSDKPAFMQEIPRISSSDLHRMKRNYRCGLASLKGVDRSFRRVYDELKRLGELDNTVFISYTDNGIFFGEHRLPFGKLNPYNEALSTPLVMRVPRQYLGGKPAVRRVTAPVANIDFAPTILRLAHAKPCKKPGNCRVMDGRSLLPLIAGRDPSWAADRPIGIELHTEHGSQKHLAACEYSGVRVGDQTFVEYRRVQKLGSDKCVRVREWERYDLAKDPFQVHNLCFGGDPGSCPDDSRQRHLRKLVRRIGQCAGIAGRDPRTGHRPYCD